MANLKRLLSVGLLVACALADETWVPDPQCYELSYADWPRLHHSLSLGRSAKRNESGLDTSKAEVGSESMTPVLSNDATASSDSFFLTAPSHADQASAPSASTNRALDATTVSSKSPSAGTASFNQTSKATHSSAPFQDTWQMLQDTIHRNDSCYLETDLSGPCGSNDLFLDDCARFANIDEPIYDQRLIDTHTFKICKGQEVYAMQCNISGFFHYSYRVISADGSIDEEGYVGHKRCGKPGRGTILIQRPVIRHEGEEGWSKFMPLIVVKTGWWSIVYPGQLRKRLEREGFLLIDESLRDKNIKQQVMETWCNAQPVFTRGRAEVSLLDLDCEYGIACHKFPKVDQGAWEGVMSKLAEALEHEQPVLEIFLIILGGLIVVAIYLVWRRAETRGALRQYSLSRWTSGVQRIKASKMLRRWFDDEDEDLKVLTRGGAAKRVSRRSTQEADMSGALLLEVLPFDEPRAPVRYGRSRRTPHGIAGIQRQWYASSGRCETVVEEEEVFNNQGKDDVQISVVVNEVRMGRTRHEDTAVVDGTVEGGASLMESEVEIEECDPLVVGAGVDTTVEPGADDLEQELFVVGEAEDSDGEVESARSIV